MTYPNPNKLQQTAGGLKIFAINASPRGKKRQYRPDFTIVFEGAQETGESIETVYLREKKINYCQGCFTCWTKTPGVCIHKDHMPELLEKSSEASIWVYATPLYAYSVCAQMKTYMDRVLPLVLPYMFKEGNHICLYHAQPGSLAKKIGGDIHLRFSRTASFFRTD